MAEAQMLTRMRDRIDLDRQEGDIAYFHALSLSLEYVTKLVVAAVVAGIGDDPDRQRYALEYTLIRSDSLGDWVENLNRALTGPAAQYFLTEATPFTRELTERVQAGDWRYAAVKAVSEIATNLGIESRVGHKAAIRQFFEIGTAIRNRTRGHGATTARQCGDMCGPLEEALNLIISNLGLFRQDWAYLRRNLAGKYRVSPLLGACKSFQYLAKSQDEFVQDGMYIYLGGPVQIRLAFSDPDVRDIFLPNGNYRNGTFEALSLISNDMQRMDGSAWTLPPGRLPPSLTHGGAVLEQVGNSFANLPPAPSGHIVRRDLETRLRDELLLSDRHPIVSLTGPGGIGKTTIALAVINVLCRLDAPPYDVILWMSSRDIDLLESGPKRVTPRIVGKSDIARVAVELLEPEQRSISGFKPEDYFQRCLANGAAGTTLFVLDNFETLDSPADVFHWLDTFIRPPNKVLITTRFRDFVGDYPIEIGGMTDDEAHALIDQESGRLGVADLVTRAYRDALIAESDGHPYVIKILLGQVAKERRARSPERIVAGTDYLLTALFERTFESLSPAAQRTFLLLCSWRVFVPAVAVEAVSLRPGNERFNVSGALDELRRFSLVDEVETEDNERFVGVPLAAASFGRRKLEVSPFKVAVDDDRKLLMEFGAGKKSDARWGVLPRIEKLVKAAAARASENPSALADFIPILEYLASRVPAAYLLLADLVLEVGASDGASDRAKTYLRRYLERAAGRDRLQAWMRLADLCHRTGDAMGEVHALGEAALLPATPLDQMGTIANRINNKIRDLKARGVEESWSSEVNVLIERVANVMEQHLSSLSAQDCSRLAWLYLNVGNDERARDVVRRGLDSDPDDEHCLNLAKKLGSS